EAYQNTFGLSDIIERTARTRFPTVMQLVSDFEIKLIQYRTNRGFPGWWQAFKDWNYHLYTI
ncbi:7042_t:CDS:1, partial [Ambispora gerdemannii]